ncbi:hypothetical protein DYBT9623_00214 [Dyadobacter sp. CECT 9623]|uniref:Uncharacterized protein n=2 Tax=Dyadobacter linearis TaxID=2823330 RepID=A0ABM8UJE0_9BACT|nr:hypothetical protein DYBT9623_00214 [Dyadobacter sp. CECT 9623]
MVPANNCNPVKLEYFLLWCFIYLVMHDFHSQRQIQDSYTRDFEEKIFEYDSFTAITTAGNAVLNGQRITQLVSRKKARNAGIAGFEYWTIEKKVTDFCLFLEEEIKAFVEANEYSIVGRTVFIFTHFDRQRSDSIIFKIETVECSSETYKVPGITAVPIPVRESAKIVCDGQNRISNGIIYGGIETVIKSVNKTIGLLITDYGFDGSVLDDSAKGKIFRDCVELIDEDIQLKKLSELSLQQAVDLAALLMRIEIDFQKYTANIPTVGGLVKIATINNGGFRFVTGHRIIRPAWM